MRLVAALQLDVRLQARNQLYGISVVVSVLAGAALCWLSPLNLLSRTVPMALLLFAGGSTLLYVVAMFLLERADGVLAALSVSPLRPWEYLVSKVATLTGLASIEGLLITAITLLWWGRNESLSWPGPLLLLGLVTLAVQHVLLGLVLVVRYDRLSQVLVQMSVIALVAQLPAFQVLGALQSPAFYLIPTAAPALLMIAAFEPLSLSQWIYAWGMTAASLLVLGVWAKRAFDTHVIERGA